MQKPFWAFHSFTVVSELADITEKSQSEHFETGAQYK